MGLPAARTTDMHVCPMVTGIVPHIGGPVIPPCAPTVLTMKLPQARVTDMCVCVGPPDMIAMGSMGVLVGGLPAARMFDVTVHGGTIVGPCAPTVLIGDSMAGAAAAPKGPKLPEMVVAGMSAASFTNQSAQAAALIGASKDGAYFCRRCNE